MRTYEELKYRQGWMQKINRMKCQLIRQQNKRIIGFIQKNDYPQIED